MKKIFLALSVLAVVAFMAVPCQALVGMPDAVPGSKVIIPFWLVQSDLQGNNTLVTLTEVDGRRVKRNCTPESPCLLHLRVFNKRSVEIHNEFIDYTKYDVVDINFGKIVKDNFGEAAMDDCKVVLNGVEHYFGYATVEDLDFARYDHWIAHLYQLDLTGGLAAGVVIPAKEIVPKDWEAGWPFPNVCAQYADAGPGPTWWRDYEAFNGDAYYSAQRKIANRGCSNAGWFRLMPRYYVHDEDTGQCYIIVWQSRNLYVPLGAAIPYPKGGLLHVFWYDEEENVYSANIDIPHEVNIIEVPYWIPGALKGGGVPWAAGWLDMIMPGSFLFATPWTTATEMLAYSWQMAEGAAEESWSVLFEVHRDAGSWRHRAELDELEDEFYK